MTLAKPGLPTVGCKKKRGSDQTRFRTDRPENTVLSGRARHNGTDVTWLRAYVQERRAEGAGESDFSPVNDTVLKLDYDGHEKNWTFMVNYIPQYGRFWFSPFFFFSVDC